MRTSYDAPDNPNDMPRTTLRSTNGQIMGAGNAHLRQISCAGKIIAASSSQRGIDRGAALLSSFLNRCAQMLT
jgi:hypothetical protein